MSKISLFLVSMVLGAICVSGCFVPPTTTTGKTALSTLAISPEGRWADLEVNVANWMQKRSLPKVDNPKPPLGYTFSRRFLNARFGEEVTLPSFEESPERYYETLDQLDQNLSTKEMTDAVQNFSEQLMDSLVGLMTQGRFFTKQPQLEVRFRDDDERLVGPNRATLVVEYETEMGSRIFTVDFLQEYETWMIDGLRTGERVIDPLHLDKELLKDDLR